VSDRELPPDIVSGTIPTDAAAGDVALRALIPPYRLGEVLLRLAEQRSTGRLALASDMGRRTIHILRGFPVFIESTLFGERLGAIAVRYGLCGREDVARALAHARESGSGLGKALLELDFLDAPRLLALLGVQLREGVAAACSSAPQRARFQHGTTALREVVVMRLHPMTAVLSAVTGLPAAEQVKLVRALGPQRVLAGTLPALAREWLADLGYLGDVDRLCEGDPTVDMVKSRLLARHRPGAERCFDADASAFSLPGARASNGRATPAASTDLVALCLLLSGSVKLAADASRTLANASGEHLANTADGVQAALGQAFDQPPVVARSSMVPPTPDGPVERAIEDYLCAKRERTLAGAAAVWGPSVEAADPTLHGELLQHYLTLKSEKRAPLVLDVNAGAGPEQVLQAYARRTAWVSSIVQNDASAHTKLRAAELAQCFDDALERIVPSGASPPPPNMIKTSDSDPAPTTSVRPRRDPTPLPRGRASVPPPRASAAPATSAVTSASEVAAPAAPSLLPDALVSKIEALLRAGNWQGVLDTFDPNVPDSALPFTVRLARAMASRELAARRQRRSVWPLILVFVLGGALGAAARPLAHAFGVDF
jgi:hypothetical protein